MGTSVSQPSPKGTLPGASDWKTAKAIVSSGGGSIQIISKILSAFSAQYNSNAKATLLDAGVQRVAQVLADKLATGANRDGRLVASFIVEARKALAHSQTNSFFAELALSAGSKAIMKGESAPARVFAVEYATKVVDYAVSRDLPTTIGSVGATNLETVKSVISGIEGEFSSRASTAQESDPIQILERLLSEAGGRRA